MLGQIQLLHNDGFREMLQQFTIGEVDIRSLIDDFKENLPFIPHDAVFEVLTENEEFFIPVVSDPETPF